jgi:hypothetical protein
MKLRRLPFQEDKWGNNMDSQESLFIQYFCYDKYSNSGGFALSQFTCGPGQVSFGRNRRQTADLLLSFPIGSIGGTLENSSDKSPRIRPELAFINYHGGYYHLRNKSCPHLMSCPLRYEEKKENEEIQISEYNEEFPIPLKPCCKSISSLSSLEEDEDIDYDRGHDFTDHEQMDLTSQNNYDFSKAYAECLSKVGNLLLSFSVYHECNIFHTPNILSEVNGKTYPNVRTLLAKAHPNDSVLGSPELNMTVEDLLDRVLTDQEKPYLDGFVLLRGGRETVQDQASQCEAGFCLQRYLPEAEELGEFTNFITKKKGYALEKRCNKGEELTIAKKSFHDEGEGMSLSFLRFLIKERGLKDFRISHFLFFPRKKFLSPFIEAMLQRRHEFKTITENLE